MGFTSYPELVKEWEKCHPRLDQGNQFPANLARFNLLSRFRFRENDRYNMNKTTQYIIGRETKFLILDLNPKIFGLENLDANLVHKFWYKRNENLPGIQFAHTKIAARSPGTGETLEAKGALGELARDHFVLHSMATWWNYIPDLETRLIGLAKARIDRRSRKETLFTVLSGQDQRKYKGSRRPINSRCLINKTKELSGNAYAYCQDCEFG